jgi:tetratricopeptide (TPR) repeat protein
MSFIRPFLVILLIVFVVGGASSVRAADVVLTMPFENESGKTEYNWIGDSFAITLANLLDAPGMVAISPEERNLAYERLGLKSSDLLTRAAMIRIADAAQANLAVIGTFDIGGDSKKTTIAIKARLVETREGRLVANKVFNLSGVLGKLQEMQGQLAWSILYERNPMITYSKDQLVKRSTLTPPRAYESFVKGVQTSNTKLSETFLKRSIQEYEAGGGPGNFADGIFRLGMLFYGQNNHAEAAKEFARLTQNDAHYLEALFFGGVSLAKTNDFRGALACFEKLLKPLPMLEVWNNAGSVMVALGNQDDALKLLRQAVANSPYDPTYRFNYGYALWRYGKFDDAADHLREAIRANPNDGEAHYILARCLKATGPVDEARLADDEARRLLDNRYARWEVAPEQMPVLARMKTEFSRAAYFKLERQQQPVAAAPVVPQSQFIVQQQQLDAARRLVSDGKDAEAATALDNFLVANPGNADAHLLRAQVYQRGNQIDKAIASYTTALSKNPRLVAAHVALGQIFLARGDMARAIAHSNQAIDIDPQNRDAVALRRQIGTGR